MGQGTYKYRKIMRTPQMERTLVRNSGMLPP